jgi:DNA-binding response OmpR family regulator/putative methionine-R-sulfoxide reductase with GAF domain
MTPEVEVNQPGTDATPPVLVVVEERFFREAICNALTGSSIACTTADREQEALELARRPGVGVVIVDIGAPGIGGVELLRKLDAQRPGQRVIVLATHTDQDLVIEALRLGACDYLAKPLHDEELALAVRRALQSFGMQANWESLRSRLVALETRLADLARARDNDESASELADRAAKAVADVLGASRTSLMLLDGDSHELRVVGVTGGGLEPSQMDPVKVGQGVAGMVLGSGEPLVVSDVAADAQFADRVAEGRYSSGSFAVAPLYGGGQALGVLCATDRRDGSGFGPEDVSLLRILALQIGSLLQPSKSAQPIESAGTRVSEEPGSEAGERQAWVGWTEASVGDADDVELARSICDALTTEIEPQRLIDAALSAVANRVPAAPVSLYLLSSDGRELVLEGQCERAENADRTRLPTDVGLTGTVFQTGRLVASDDPDRDPRFSAEVDTPEGGPVRPLLCVPVILRGKTMGVLRVFPMEGASASARTGEILTAAISAAVRNVLMYRSLLESVDEVAKARRGNYTQA